MRFELMENGIDSLKFGMDFYERYLNLEDKYNPSENPGYLKMAVICFHNSLELFAKKLLINENELLIYTNISDDKILELLRHQKNSNRKIPLDYFMISDQINILTISYKECIKRLGIIFDLSLKEKQVLEDMGSIRNKLTHFGLDKLIDFHEVLIIVNSSLRMLANFYFDELFKKEKSVPDLERIFENLLDLIEMGEAEEKETWEIYFADNFDLINETLDSLGGNSEFTSKLMKEGYSIEVILGEYSHSPNGVLRIFDGHGELWDEIYGISMPAVDATIFASGSSNGPIYFIIDHERLLLEDPKNCFVYHEPEERPDFCLEDKKFWEQDAQNKVKKCYGTEFNQENLIRIILKNVLSIA